MGKELVGLVRSKAIKSGIHYSILFGKLKRMVEQSTGRKFVISSASPEELRVALKAAQQL